jgi:actin-related protein 5
MFGISDKDWDVYHNNNNNNKEQDISSIESINDIDYSRELQKIDSLLKIYDKSAFVGNPLSSISINDLDYNVYLSSERYLLSLSTHSNALKRIRVPEILFQPSLVGSDQMGVIECT